jgi:hypothetical protein
VQTFTRGCLTVFAVVVAIDLLGTGEPGVGVLGAAVGAVGWSARCSPSGWWVVAGSPLVRGRDRAVRGAAVGIGAGPERGGGDRAARPGRDRQRADRRRRFTLLARLADETVLARMFAGFEAILTLGVAAGGLVTPLVVDGSASRPRSSMIGLLAPLAVAASWPALRRLDHEVRGRNADIESMRMIRMLGALRSRPREQLVAELEHAEFERRARRCSRRAIRASASTSSNRAGRTWRSTAASSACWAPASASARSPCCATSRAPPRSARRPMATLRVSRLRRSAYLTAVTGYPAAAAEGEALVASRFDADAERLREAARMSGAALPAAGAGCHHARMRRHRTFTTAVLALLLLALPASASAAVTATKIRIASHRGFVRVVVDFTGGTVRDNDVEMAPGNIDQTGRARLEITKAGAMTTAAAKRASGVRASVSRTPKGLRVRFTANAHRFKFLHYHAVTTPTRLVVDLYRRNSRVALNVGGCVKVGSNSTSTSARWSRAARRSRSSRTRSACACAARSGNVVSARTVTNPPGPWSAVLRHHVATRQTGLVEAFVLSAKDGALQCLSQRPITLRP